jgi:hypothetical protein
MVYRNSPQPPRLRAWIWSSVTSEEEIQRRQHEQYQITLCGLGSVTGLAMVFPLSSPSQDWLPILRVPLLSSGFNFSSVLTVICGLIFQDFGLAIWIQGVLLFLRAFLANRNEFPVFTAKKRLRLPPFFTAITLSEIWIARSAKTFHPQVKHRVICLVFADHKIIARIVCTILIEMMHLCL